MVAQVVVCCWRLQVVLAGCALAYTYLLFFVDPEVRDGYKIEYKHDRQRV